MLLSFLQLSPGGMIRIRIKFEIAWGVDDSTITRDLLEPLLVHPDIFSWESHNLRMRIHVNIIVNPRELITTKSMLVRTSPFFSSSVEPSAPSPDQLSA